MLEYIWKITLKERRKIFGIIATSLFDIVLFDFRRVSIVSNVISTPFVIDLFVTYDDEAAASMDIV